MKNVDKEFMVVSLDFIKCVKKVDKFFFVWFNLSCMYMYMCLSDESCYLVEEYIIEYDLYGSGLIEYD